MGEVKDDLIPFLEFLEKYYLSEEPIGLHKVLLTYTTTYTLYDVVNSLGTS
jgi:hypothetical protein